MNKYMAISVAGFTATIGFLILSFGSATTVS